MDEIKKIAVLFETELQGVKDLPALEALKIKYAGKKGELSRLFELLAGKDTSEKKELGRLLNELKIKINSGLSTRTGQISLLKEKTGFIDVTMPGIPLCRGGIHPVTWTISEIEKIFVRAGFRVAVGPEIEDEYHNFEALNIGADHPSRDMWDTFYLQKSKIGQNLLRTHTSPVQVRVMEKFSPPFAIIVPGRVFRRDSDATHVPMFHQVEGLFIDREVSMAHLKGILEYFAKAFFGQEFGVRLRPSYFPFTEPSCEVDISCVLCKGAGCAVCKNSGWIEILGAGLVHKKVLEYGKINPAEFSGYAFGMGVERIAMLKFGLNDMRLLFENDIRFLREFNY